MNPFVSAHLDGIAALCRRYEVARLDLFGSAVEGAFDPDHSDLDFVAEFENPAPTADYADRVLGFSEALEALLQRRVDVITALALRGSRFADAIASTRKRIYDVSQPTAA